MIKQQGILCLFVKPREDPTAAQAVSNTRFEELRLYFSYEEDILLQIHANQTLVKNENRPASSNHFSSLYELKTLLVTFTLATKEKRRVVIDICAIYCHKDTANEKDLLLKYISDHSHHDTSWLRREGQISEVEGQPEMCERRLMLKVGRHFSIAEALSPIEMF